MKYWLALLKAGAHSTLCEGRKHKRGGEGKTRRSEKSEVTEFIPSAGPEPTTCLWVSVAVPVHVFSLLSGRPLASKFMSKLFHCVGPSRLDSVFFPCVWVLSESCDCLRICLRPS